MLQVLELWVYRKLLAELKMLLCVLRVRPVEVVVAVVESGDGGGDDDDDVGAKNYKMFCKMIAINYAIMHNFNIKRFFFS